MFSAVGGLADKKQAIVKRSEKFVCEFTDGSLMRSGLDRQVRNNDQGAILRGRGAAIELARCRLDVGAKRARGSPYYKSDGSCRSTSW